MRDPSRAEAEYPWMERKPMVPRIAKIVMTTTSSTKVNPRRRAWVGIPDMEVGRMSARFLEIFVLDVEFICAKVIKDKANGYFVALYNAVTSISERALL